MRCLATRREEQETSRYEIRWEKIRQAPDRLVIHPSSPHLRPSRLTRPSALGQRQTRLSYAPLPDTGPLHIERVADSGNSAGSGRPAGSGSAAGSGSFGGSAAAEPGPRFGCRVDPAGTLAQAVGHESGIGGALALETPLEVRDFVPLPSSALLDCPFLGQLKRLLHVVLLSVAKTLGP